MKLAVKGALLICIPVAVQVMIVITFASLLWRAQTFAAHQVHAKEIISECDKLVINGFQVARKVLKLSGEVEPVTDEEVQELKQHSATIEKQLTEDGMGENGAEIGAVIGNLYNMLTEVREQQKVGNYKFEKRMFKILEGTMGQISRVIDIVNSQQLETVRSRSSSKS